MEELLANLPADPVVLASEYISFLRYALPVLAMLLLMRCFFCRRSLTQESCHTVLETQLQRSVIFALAGRKVDAVLTARLAVGIARSSRGCRVLERGKSASYPHGRFTA